VETLTLLFLLHVVVVIAFVSARAIHLRLAPVPARSVAAGAGHQDEPGAAPPVLSGRQLEAYVQAGLDDLRIMLAQAARRHRE
jgi:hypothetical protein